MVNESDPQLVQFCRRYAASAGIAVALIGASVLIGWIANIPLLTRLSASWVSMKANTAAGLLVAGVALFLATPDHGDRGLSAVVLRFCGVIVAAIGLATLVECASGRSIGIDQLLITEPPGTIGTAIPGRMAPLTALSFALCGPALLTLNTKAQRYAWLSAALTLPVLLFSLLASLGYVYGAKEFYSIAGRDSGMAVHTSAAFLLLGTGIVLARPEHGLARRLASGNSGGAMLRRLLPLVILLPALIVWLRLKGQAYGLFNTIEFGAASVAAAVMVSMSIVVVWCAALLDRMAAARMGREEELRQLNASLDRLVAARTADLAKANERLAELSITDELTGAFNRRYLLLHGPIELQRAKRFGRPVAFLFLDLDHFKRVNDRFGHQFGDLVLSSFSDLCCKTLRPSDLFVRYGGEEFVAVLPETGLEAAVVVARRIAQQMRQTVFSVDPPLKGLTVSIGVSALRGDDDTLEAILERIDKAMYRAKELDRDRVETVV